MKFRASRWGPAAVVALVLGATPPASARDDEKGKPFGRGTIQPSLGLGGSFGGDLSVLSFGAGINYFFWHGLAAGLFVSNTTLFYSRAIKADFPGIATQTPTNIFQVTPSLQWVFVRTHRFSPYVLGGVGPVLFNHGGGTVGHWLAGAGAFIGLSPRVFLSLGVNFTGMFPLNRCRDAFIYEAPSGQRFRTADPCSFRWGPQLGLQFSF